MFLQEGYALFFFFAAFFFGAFFFGIGIIYNLVYRVATAPILFPIKEKITIGSV
jgi:hypothetical protein